MKKEIWSDLHPIPGLPTYFVYRDGRVLSAARNGRKERFLKIQIVLGYPKVNFTVKNKSVWKFLHRILAETFIPNPKNLPVVNHKDGNKLNYALENLEWCTVQQNIRHAWDTGLKKPICGEKNHRAVLTSRQVKEIRRRVFAGEVQRRLSEEFGVSFGTISKIKLGTRWNEKSF